MLNILPKIYLFDKVSWPEIVARKDAVKQLAEAFSKEFETTKR